MKFFKRLMAAACSAAMLCALPVGATFMDSVLAVNTSTYGAITGTVQEVTPRYDSQNNEIEGAYTVQLTYGTEGLATFTIDSDTVFVTDSEIEVGDTFTGYYDARLPMILIYPPQYRAVAAAVNLSTTTGFRVAQFDENLLSEDGLLKLELADDSSITLPDGTEYTGEPGGNHLAVLFDSAADSAPQLGRVIKAVMLPQNNTETEPAAPAEIMVNGTPLVDAPAIYLKDDGTVMVPLRAVAEALGYEVGWDDTARTVTVGKAITLTIDKDYYTFARMAPIELGTAPEISSDSDRTYVPLSFFTQVMQLEKAEYADELVIIQDKTP